MRFLTINLLGVVLMARVKVFQILEILKEALVGSNPCMATSSILKLKEKKKNTSAEIRTRVRALATPGDNHYTTDVLLNVDV